MSGAVYISSALRSSSLLLAAVCAACLCGCEEPPTESKPAGAKSAALASAPTPVPTPSVAPKPPPKPRDDCPEGSSGPGTFDAPCQAKGTARLMEVEWTGKIGDAGPSFRVTNQAKQTIIYGALVAYFYDKAGKQLGVPAAGGKTRPKQLCSGKIFAGVMKPEEKAVLTFSCVKKRHVPEGTETIEAEMQTVGFVDASGSKTDFYWRNEDLTPDERPKGGIKAE